MAILVPVFRESQIVNLLDWASQIAAAEKEELEVVWCIKTRDGDGVLNEEPELESLPKDLMPWLDHVTQRHEFFSADKENKKVKIFRLRAKDLFSSLMRIVDERSTRMLVLGKLVGARGDDAPESVRVATKLYEKAHCDVILFRLSRDECGLCEKILLPVAGGPNSRRALRLADKLSLLNKGSMTPLYVLPNSDEVAEEVGKRILTSSLIKARVPNHDREGIEPKVLLESNVIKAIRNEVRDDSYHLVLIGGANASTVRQKLFGTIPDKLIGGEDGVTIAIMRRAFPITERLKQFAGRMMALSVPQLSREDRVKLFENLQTHSRWSFDFMALIVLSTAIAALGLTQNSPAVIIGAMLVAPLMTPLLGSGLAIVQGNAPLMKDSAKAIGLGFLSAVLIGVLMGYIAKPFSGLTPEMLARGGPSLLDMGVGFFSGVAAAYCLARPGLSSALAGVAIAAALVPPIATVGMSLSLGDMNNAQGAALLFGTNVVAIILGAALTFFFAGIRGRKSAEESLWVRRVVGALVLSLAVLTIPLGSVIVSEIVQARTETTHAQLKTHFTEMLSKNVKGAELLSYSINNKDPKLPTLEVRMAAPEVPSQEQVNALQDIAEKKYGKKIKLRLFTDLVRESD